MSFQVFFGVYPNIYFTVLQCILYNNIRKIMIAINIRSTQKKLIIFAAANTLKGLWQLHAHPLLSHQETKKIK